MQSKAIENFFNSASRRNRLIVWGVGLSVVALLSTFRIATDAEFAFFSAAIIPLMAVTWVGGRKDGLWFSVIVAVMWVASDLLTDRQFSAYWIPVLNALTLLGVYSLVAFLTSKVIVLLAREREFAVQDALTGLMNRRALFEVGEAEADRHRRYGHTLAVAFLDLDNFKQLNDDKGHVAGDKALEAVAMALRRAVRKTDRIARFGGDEFAVLLPEIGYDNAVDAGAKIAAAINLSLAEFSPVSVSVGVAWFDDAGLGFPAMLKAADDLMYDIKQEGKHGMKAQRFTRPGASSPTNQGPPVSTLIS